MNLGLERTETGSYVHAQRIELRRGDKESGLYRRE